MRHLTAAPIDGGFHYASLSRRGGYPLGHCAEHPPHPTADDARRCYRTWEREHVALDLQLGNWSGCAAAGCDHPTKAGAPVDLDPVDLEPGFVIVRCPVCDASQVGRPGDSLDHADEGAHVYSTTYGGGA